MAKTTAPGASRKHSKKEIRKSIQEKLTVTLADYKAIIGQKKFDSRIRKAARRLGTDIAKALPKKAKGTTETA